jgi:hypothetical protein
MQILNICQVNFEDIYVAKIIPMFLFCSAELIDCSKIGEKVYNTVELYIKQI